MIVAVNIEHHLLIYQERRRSNLIFYGRQQREFELFPLSKANRKSFLNIHFHLRFVKIDIFFIY